jgi:hypothetical protein
MSGRVCVYCWPLRCPAGETLLILIWLVPTAYLPRRCLSVRREQLAFWAAISRVFSPFQCAKFCTFLPLAFVLSSLNIRRRQLTATQLAFVALKIEEVEGARAKERMAAGGAIGGASKGTEKIPDPLPDTGEARSIAAKAVGANAHYVSDAKRLVAKAPDVAAAARAGR